MMKETQARHIFCPHRLTVSPLLPAYFGFQTLVLFPKVGSHFIGEMNESCHAGFFYNDTGGSGIGITGSVPLYN